MSLLFSRESRLLSSTDFKQVFDAVDVKISCKYVLILAKANKLKQPRLGLIVAKKNIRSAVNRNRAKRHIRETFRLKKDEIGNLDVVVLVRKGLNELSDNELNQFLNKQWQKLKHKVGSREIAA